MLHDAQSPCHPGAGTAPCADPPLDLPRPLLRGNAAVLAGVLVLDPSRPGRSGFDLMRRVARHWPSRAVLVCTMHDSPPMLARGATVDGIAQALIRAKLGLGSAIERLRYAREHRLVAG
jgi:hypothetical protein